MNASLAAILSEFAASQSLPKKRAICTLQHSMFSVRKKTAKYQAYTCQSTRPFPRKFSFELVNLKPLM
jgi:hypothetical protein